MSLLTSEVYPALAGVASSQDQATTHTLTHTGAGWALLTRRAGSPRGWSTPLAPHGAGPDAAPRVAQAVGVRVLHELGIEVAGWIPEPAGVDGSADVVAVTAIAGASPRSRLGGLRGH